MTRLRRVLSEPLFHFLLLGIAIFAGYSIVRGSGWLSGPDEIVVTEGKLAQLAEGFAQTWQRPPSPDEQVGLVRDWIREEVYYREALALGLDKDDTVIRRRLKEKMRFLSSDIAAQSDPSDADLEEYMTQHPESFREEPRYSFVQVYLNPSNHGDAIEADATRLLARLRREGAQADVSTVGDPILLEQDYADTPASEVARLFGKEFAEGLAGLEPGDWQGPVASGFGMHLVYLREKVPGRIQPLDEVRDLVRREWENEKRLDLEDKIFQEMLKNYTIRIEGLELDEDTLRDGSKSNS